MELAASQAFANFRAWVPRNALTVGSAHPQSWTYYDWGPRSYSEPLVCFHSLVGSPESFFHQVISLAPRGYRVISVQIPVYWSVDDFCDAFNAFLNMLNLPRIHIYAAGLGGFLALHFTSRKPERIASIALTHSFLSSEPIKKSVPYSPSVLRWLPDFLVRSTMKSIFPKGRTSRDQALAAEFAIGHTLSASRDILASRLALFVSTSSVTSHLPKSNTTLIDTLDRAPNSLQLSNSVAKELSGARLALLKYGGDFPYLSVPDEVNVHLIVHLRRHAPSPDSPIPLPPAARPHPLPAFVIQRKREEETKAQQEAANSTSNSTHQSKSERTHESMVAEARALVSAEERATIEKYCFEISRLREILPDRDDRFLAAIMVDCSGNVDSALANASKDAYSQHFYEEFHDRAVHDALVNLPKQEDEGDPNSQTRNDTERDSAIGDTEDNGDEAGIRQGGPEYEEDHEHDPLGGTNVVVNGGSHSVDGVDPRDSKSARDGLRTKFRNIRETPQNDGFREVEDKNSVEYDSEIGSNSPVSDGNGLGDQPTRSGRRRRMDNNAMNEVSAYMTSERVGMRSPGPMVGRGPTPFKAATVTEDTWAQPRSPSPGGGKHDSLEVVRTDDDNDVIASGASLLEASGNPLDLPGAEVSDRVSETGRSGWNDSVLLSPEGPSMMGMEVSSDGRGGSNLWESFNRQDDNDKDGTDERVGENADDKFGQSDPSDIDPEEEERLRMWSMSALAAASKSVPR